MVARARQAVRRHAGRRLTDALALLLAAALVASGALMLRADSEEHERVAELARAATGPSCDGWSGIDWDALASQNPSVAAWLRVEGTTVDVPVVTPPVDLPEWYLSHDFWGSPSTAGCPYLGPGCRPSDGTLIVYGHRTLYESYMFHDLADAFEPEPFSRLGSASWSTRSGQAAFRPLCAASVRQDDQGWQRVGGGTSELRSWLSWAVASSSASSPDAEAAIGTARRALVLVTCNGRPLHPRTRTVVVFVAP